MGSHKEEHDKDDQAGGLEECPPSAVDRTTDEPKLCGVSRQSSCQPRVAHTRPRYSQPAKSNKDQDLAGLWETARPCLPSPRIALLRVACGGILLLASETPFDVLAAGRFYGAAASLYHGGGRMMADDWPTVGSMGGDT